MLRCKFKVSAVQKDGESGRAVTMNATNSTEGDNKDWSQYTPNGTLQFYVTNPAAFPKIDALKPGTLVWLDITPVE